MQRVKKPAKRLRKHIFKPYLKMLLMRILIFYQKHLSRHTCLYEPTCSEYMLRSINNIGVICGIFAGLWRLLRCNPFSRGGYDPAPESKHKYKWII
ncbi:MAG: membrane protein insertion efficiency factor YidD [Clostridia bacterium]|nr:membrane protein insertion efficiency factor YidD [Clostridia bacterium]